MLNEILEILNAELEMVIENVSEDTTLASVGIDSITFMTLIVYLEEKYGIEFSFDGIFMQEYTSVTFKNLMEEICALLDKKA